LTFIREVARIAEMFWGAVAAVVLAACTFNPSGGSGTVIDAAKDARRIDGALDAPLDTPSCPSSCTNASGTCKNGFCVITVTGDSATCPANLPANLPCELDCPNNSTCNGTLACNGSPNCSIKCQGNQTCGGTIDCTGIACEVHCDGMDTCGSNTIKDGGSGGSCVIDCCSPSACFGAFATPTQCGAGSSCP
jgi:hypothetical protein